MNTMKLHEHLLKLARDRAEEERAMTMTPETDAFIVKMERIGVRISPEAIDHAKQLEQRCNALAARVAELEQAERRAERLQAQVDALMLEYCPDEMTPEQLAEWEKHQRAVPAEFKGE